MTREPDDPDLTDAELGILLCEAGDGPMPTATPGHLEAVRSALLARCEPTTVTKKSTRSWIGRTLAAALAAALLAAIAVDCLAPRSVLAEMQAAMRAAPIVHTRMYAATEATTLTESLAGKQPSTEVWSHAPHEASLMVMLDESGTQGTIAEINPKQDTLKVLTLSESPKLTIRSAGNAVEVGESFEAGIDIMSDRALAEFDADNEDVMISPVKRFEQDGRLMRSFTFTHTEDGETLEATYLIDDATNRAERALLRLPSAEEEPTFVLLAFAYPEEGPRTIADLDLPVDLATVETIDATDPQALQLVKTAKHLRESFAPYEGYVVEHYGGRTGVANIATLERFRVDGGKWRIERLAINPVERQMKSWPQPQGGRLTFDYLAEQTAGDRWWVREVSDGTSLKRYEPAAKRTDLAATGPVAVQLRAEPHGVVKLTKFADRTPLSLPHAAGYPPLGLTGNQIVTPSRTADDRPMLSLQDLSEPGQVRVLTFLSAKRPLLMTGSVSQFDDDGQPIDNRHQRLERVLDTALTPSGTPYPLHVQRTHGGPNPGKSDDHYVIRFEPLFEAGTFDVDNAKPVPMK